MDDRIVMLVLGLALIALGAVNISGNISTIHSYNRSRVSAGDIPAYGRAVGSGTAVIGAGITLTAVLNFFTESALTYIATVAGVVVGLALILYGQFRYNKGLF